MHDGLVFVEQYRPLEGNRKEGRERVSHYDVIILLIHVLSILFS